MLKNEVLDVKKFDDTAENEAFEDSRSSLKWVSFTLAGGYCATSEDRKKTILLGWKNQSPFQKFSNNKLQDLQPYQVQSCALRFASNKT